jgi:two-component system response regulator ChvI
MTDINRRTPRANLAVVDDDALFRESITQNLEEAGFSVAGCCDGRAALDRLTNGPRPDIVLLDWKMPELSGIEVLKRMRAAKIDVPVIFLTVLGDQIYEEAALLGGAVDFVEKSRSFSILLRRIELTLSRLQVGETKSEPEASKTFVEYGPIRLKLDSNRVAWKGRQVDLSLSEFRLVKLMVEQAGRDVSYRDLYDLVHGEGFVAGEGDIGYRANVRAFVKRIRQKFRDVDREFNMIGNYPGFGYRWGEEDAS